MTPPDTMNTTSSSERSKLARDMEMRASHMPYRVAILAAIESLHDFQTRSSVDSIRKFVKSNLPPEVDYNNNLFLTTLRQAIQEGELERNASFCNFSQSMKLKRTDEIVTLLEKKQTIPSSSNRDPDFAEKDERKDATLKKTVHSKAKITPKKVLDKASIKNPMETI